MLLLESVHLPTIPDLYIWLWLFAEYVFDAGLNNHDRAIVHAECKKYGFTSKSYG